MPVSHPEHRPPVLRTNQKQERSPGNDRPVNPNPRPRQQDSAEPFQNLRHRQTEDDRDQNGEVTELIRVDLTFWAQRGSM